MQPQRERLDYWIALSLAPGVGPVRFAKLLAQYQSPHLLFHNPAMLSEQSPQLADYLRNPDWQQVECTLQWREEGPSRHLITLDDPRYPERLKGTADPPPILYVTGEPAVLGEPQLAMVGSRNPTATGRETTRDFARHLARMGLTLTSGLATGVDAETHQGALDVQGTTIAVFGTGLDRVYPARHRDLAHAIVDGGGALVSEYPIGTPPLPEHFPRRNRIISGLSLGTLVVEAALRSGSLITARMAMEQGREVFAVPGSIHNPLARGCHRLIRDGAKLVETGQDIIEELAPQLQDMLDSANTAEPEGGTAMEPSDEELDQEYRELLESMDDAPLPVDRIVERSGLTAESVSSMLLLLELRGWVVSSAGGYARSPKRLQ